MEVALHETPGRRRAESLILGAIALLILFLAVRTALRVADNRSAFRRWQPQLLQIQNGADLSAQFNYPYPPITAVLLEPLALLPPIPASLLWFSAKVVMAGLAFHGIKRLIERETNPFPRSAWLVVVLCGLKPILDDLSHGNVNILILFLIVACMTAFHARRDLLAGLLLSLAIACKLTPLLLVLFFAWKRAWRVLSGVVLGLALFLWPGFVPAARLGLESHQRQLTSWYHLMVHPYLVQGKVTSEHLNQSLPGLWTRMTTRSPSFIGWHGLDEVPLRYDNLMDWSPSSARVVLLGMMFAFLILLIWTCQPSTEIRHGWRLVGEGALVTLGMLLFSERTWKHHAVTLILPFAVLIWGLCRLPLHRRARLGLVALLVISMGLLLIPGLGSSGKSRLEVWKNPDFAKLAQVYGAYTWAFLLLAAGLVFLLKQPLDPVRAGDVGETADSQSDLLARDPAIDPTRASDPQNLEEGPRPFASPGCAPLDQPPSSPARS